MDLLHEEHIGGEDDEIHEDVVYPGVHGADRVLLDVVTDHVRYIFFR